MTKALIDLIAKAVIDLPDDVEESIRKARQHESNKRALVMLDSILENIKVARADNAPLCQDTGVLVFYVKHGDNINRSLLEESIIEAVRRATDEIPLRANIVDPLSRVNTDDNTGYGIPRIYYEYDGGLDDVEVTVLPKGAGSENTTSIGMLNPGEGVDGLIKYVVDSVKCAGGKPCPPTIVGVGVGGTAETALYLAKKSLLRDVGSHHPVKQYRELESRLYGKINELGVGVMGVGGDTTCLGVHVEYADCHTASLPVAVNLQCWAARKATTRI